MDVPIERGVWAVGSEAPPEARIVPGQEGTVRVIIPKPVAPCRREVAGLAAGTSALFPVPSAATLDERESLPAQAFLPEPQADGGCASVWALRLLARAWSAQGLSPKDILVVSGSGCCLEEPLFPRTYGVRVPAGRAMAVAAGAKLANPSLAVAALDDGAAIFSAGFAQFIHTVRCNEDFLVLVFPRGTGPAWDLLGSAQQAGAKFLARVPAEDETASAALIGQALAHKGLAILEMVCPASSVPKAGPTGMIVFEQGKPTFEATEPALLSHGAPVGIALDLRPGRCSRLPEEFL
jgi:hypothetical protein